MTRNNAKATRPRTVDVTQNLTYRLLLLSNTLGRAAAHQLMDLVQITVPEWRIISVVGSRGPLSLNELTQLLAVDKGWVSRTLVSLEKRGYMARAAQPDDGRMFMLSLTKAGRDLHLEASDWSLNRQKRLRSSMTPAEYAKLEEYLTRLQDVADEMLEKSDGVKT